LLSGETVAARRRVRWRVDMDVVAVLTLTSAGHVLRRFESEVSTIHVGDVHEGLNDAVAPLTMLAVWADLHGYEIILEGGDPGA
jgi:hypothetical protein